MFNKELIINMISSIVAFIINMGINFILSPYIINNVGVEAYGFISLANNFINYASLLTIALNSMAGRFITISLHRKDIDKANQYFNSILISNILIGVILCVISGVFVCKLEDIINVPQNILLDIKILFLFLFLNFIISVITSIFGIATFATNKLYLTSLRAIEGNVIRVILLISMFMILKPNVSYVGVVAFIVTVYSSVFNIYYTKKLLPQINISKKIYNFKVIIEVLESGIWNVFTKLSSILSNGLDLLIANLFLGATAMGTLSLSKTIPTVILSVFGMLASIFSPELTKSYAKGNLENMKSTLISSMRLLGVLATIPMTILIVYGNNFFKLWVPGEDAQLLQLLSIVGSAGMIFALPLEGLWNIFTVTNKIKESSIFLFFNSLLTIIIVIISIQFVDSTEYRMYIIAGVSTIFSIIRALTFLPIYGAKCIGVKWYTFYPQIFINTIGFAILSILAYLIKFVVVIDSWIKLFFVITIISFIGLIINYFLVLKKAERKKISNFCRDKIIARNCYNKKSEI